MRQLTALLGSISPRAREGIKTFLGARHMSNRHLTVGLDGIVEMSEEDAACLIPAGWIKLPDGAATT